MSEKSYPSTSLSNAERSPYAVEAAAPLREAALDQLTIRGENPRLGLACVEIEVARYHIAPLVDAA